MAFPMPLLLPVTIATLSVRRFMRDSFRNCFLVLALRILETTVACGKVAPAL